MATIADASAEANIKAAAALIGIHWERIIDILTTTDAVGSVEFNDGSSAASAATFLTKVRVAFNQRGLPDEKADQFIAVMGARYSGIVADVTVPDLEGETLEAAAQACRAAGLVPSGSYAADLGDFPVGTVDDQQDPAADAAAELGDEVTFEAQAGQTVPDVLTESEADADTALELAGLDTGTVTYILPPDEEDVDTVFAQDPEAGELVEYGDTVDLTVIGVAVPDSVDVLKATFLAALTAAGLVEGTESTDNHATIAAGNVIISDPEEGTVVADGSTVDYTTSLGPE